VIKKKKSEIIDKNVGSHVTFPILRLVQYRADCLCICIVAKGIDSDDIRQ